MGLKPGYHHKSTDFVALLSITAHRITSLAINKMESSTINMHFSISGWDVAYIQLMKWEICGCLISKYLVGFSHLIQVTNFYFLKIWWNIWMNVCIWSPVQKWTLTDDGIGKIPYLVTLSHNYILCWMTLD